nr:MAG TPA: hypothetical protein [Caudoviricetes sp.]
MTTVLLSVSSYYSLVCDSTILLLFSAWQRHIIII